MGISEDLMSEYLQPSQDQGDLAQLSRLAEEQAEAELQVAGKESELKAATDRLKDLAERQVPELMDKLGMETFKTTSGLGVSVKETIRASITRENSPLAFKWLEDNGHAALIDRTLSVKLGKGEEEAAKEIHKMLDGKFDVDDKRGVHARTLSAFVKEKLQVGKDIPLDLFSVHRQRVSKIVLPKGKSK